MNYKKVRLCNKNSVWEIEKEWIDGRERDKAIDRQEWQRHTERQTERDKERLRETDRVGR